MNNISLNDIEHITKFENQGKQGFVGLVKYKPTDEILVYKISQYMNYLPIHEWYIMKGLETLEPYCPHFCHAEHLVKLPIHPNFRDENQNPFETSDYALELDVLFMEYIKDAIPLVELIEDPKLDIPFYVIISIIKQVLLALLIAQEKKFTHFDLHSVNILITKIPENVVNVYHFNDHTFVVPTYGYMPHIIDFGFSTIKNIYNHPIRCALAYTDAGYMSPVFDPIADAKILLVSILDDLRYARDYLNDEDIHLYRNIVHNFFDCLNIDWGSGWDIRNEWSIMDQCFDYIENDNETSKLFYKFPHYCMDMMQSLVKYPIPSHEPEESSLPTLRKAYKWIVHEFQKIEEEINNTLQSLFIFRNIIDLVKNEDLKLNYSNSPLQTSNMFRKDCFTLINNVAKYCKLENVDFNRLLCAFYAFQEQLEIQLSIRLQYYLKQKNKEYSLLTCKSLKEMCCIFDYHFPEKIENITNHEFWIWDVVNKTNNVVVLELENENDQDLIQNLENITTVYLGHEIMNLL